MDLLPQQQVEYLALLQLKSRENLEGGSWLIKIFFLTIYIRCSINRIYVRVMMGVMVSRMEIKFKIKA